MTEAPMMMAGPAPHHAPAEVALGEGTMRIAASRSDAGQARADGHGLGPDTPPPLVSPAAGVTAAHAGAASDQAPRRLPLGLRLCQLAVPALAIPSAIGINAFFSLADGVAHPTLQGVVAAVGFELANIGLSLLEVRRPELHARVRAVRFWSVSAAVTMNVIAHYAVAAANTRGVQIGALVFAVIASAPLAFLYVQLAALLHAISAAGHAEGAEDGACERALEAARTSQEGLAAELAQAREDERAAQEGLAAELAQARAGAAAAGRELAQAREDERAAQEELAQARAAAAAVGRELAQAREGEGADVAALQEELAQVCAQAAAAAGKIAALQAELARLGDRSRAATVAEARRLAAERGWGASQIGALLGWPESTVRRWLAAVAAD